MQGGRADGRAADEHRLEHREGRRPAGATDGDHDLLQQGGALLGRVLEGDRPPGGVRRRAQLAALGQRVDLHDHSVDLVVEVVAVLEPVLGVGEDLLQRTDGPHVRVDGEAETFQPVE